MKERDKSEMRSLIGQLESALDRDDADEVDAIVSVMGDVRDRLIESDENG